MRQIGSKKKKERKRRAFTPKTVKQAANSFSDQLRRKIFNNNRIWFNLKALALKPECAACLDSARRLEQSFRAMMLLVVDEEVNTPIEHVFVQRDNSSRTQTTGPPKAPCRKPKLATLLWKNQLPSRPRKNKTFSFFYRAPALQACSLVETWASSLYKLQWAGRQWKCSSKQHKRQCTPEKTIVTALCFS